MCRTGLTLVEVLIVLAMIGILLAVATSNWNSLVRKDVVEREAKTLHADLVATRLEALYTKRPRSVVLSGARFLIYTSCETSVEPALSRTLSYPLRFSVPGASLTLTFDAGGLLTAGADTPICLDPANDLSVDNPGAVDCVVVSPARTKLGKRQGGACDTANITQK